MRSMTGFSRAHLKTSQGELTLEMSSVNRRQKDVQFILPKQLSALEQPLREQFLPTFQRGSLTVKIGMDKNAPSVTTDSKGMAQLYAHYLALSEEVYGEKQPLRFEFLVERFEQDTLALPFDAQDALYDEMRKPIEKAIAQWKAYREREGDAICRDFLKRIERIQSLLVSVQELSGDAKEKMQAKLKEAMEGLTSSDEDHADRLAREVVLYAEKVDTTEECLRLQTHLETFVEVCQSEKEAKGKALEFVTQECNRELHTLSSKAYSIEVTKLALAMREELESIREQVMNIE